MARGKPAMGEIWIGISGWRYEGWRRVFYPRDLPHKRELEFASRALPTIEINGSFYSLQTPQSYAAWYRETPADFVFSVMGGRYITHIRRLRDIETPLANFFASGVLEMREKLGPFLCRSRPVLGRSAPERLAVPDRGPLAICSRSAPRRPLPHECSQPSSGAHATSAASWPRTP